LGVCLQANGEAAHRHPCFPGRWQAREGCRRRRARSSPIPTTKVFSAASLWEIAIKSGLGRKDFRVDAGELRSGLIENEYTELAVSGTHAILTSILPPIHKDPFDRILVAQATMEGLTLLTCDPIVAKYEGPVRTV
jgi:PIN domain nuclease of toxin-antitoxin system